MSGRAKRGREDLANLLRIRLKNATAQMMYERSKIAHQNSFYHSFKPADGGA
jgi:hypothetical protein